MQQRSLGALKTFNIAPIPAPLATFPWAWDATVIWPHQDLIIRNPFPFPLLILSLAKDGTHRVEIRGRAAPREVQWEREWHGTRPFTTKSQVDPTLPAGTRDQVQRGIRGYTVTVIRELQEGSSQWSERQTLVYPPVNEIIKLGAGRATVQPSE